MADNQVIIEFVSDTSGLKAAADQLLALGQISKKQYDEFIKANNAANDAAQKAAKSEQDLAKSANNAAKSGKQLNNEFRELTKIIAGGVIDTIAEDFKHLADETQKTTQQFASAKAELRELAKQITSGQLTGKQLEEAKRRAAELKDNIGDVNNEIRMLASDTRRIDLVVEGVRGITAAFSVATSATALFGEENEDLQKALLKVQAAMALATGVQELANIATTKGGIATKAYGFAIQTVDKIQKAFAISSAAAWAAATGGIALAVGALAYFISSTDDANEENKALNKTLKDQKDELAKLEIEYLNASKQIDDYTKSLKLLELERKRQIALISAEAEEKALKDSQGLLTRMLGFINPSLAAQMQVRSFVSGYEKEIKSNEKKIAGINAIFAEQEKILRAENAEKQKEINKKAAEDAKKKEKEKYDFINAQNKKFIEDQIRMDEMLLSLAEGNSDEQLRIYGEIIEGKKELARVDPDLSPAMKEAIYKTLEADYAKYRDNLLMIAAQATQKANEQDKEALKQLQTNRQLEQGLIEDFGITREQIDEEYAKSSFETFAEYEKWKRAEMEKTTAKLKQEAELRQQLENAIRTATIESAKAGIDSLFQLEAQKSQQRIDMLAEMREREIIDAGDDLEKKKRIEEKYAKEIAIVRRRQAIAERAQALFGIVMAVQEGIAKAQAATAAIPALIPPGIPNPAFAAAKGIEAATIGQLIATSAIRTALLLAQPLPGFAKGTKKAPPGMKWVGEQGPELINDKGGYAIIPNKEAMQIAAKWDVPTLPSVSDDVQTSLQMPVGIDYTRLARTLAMELRNNPQTNIKFDKTGFASYLITQSERKQILNNRYAA